MRLAGNFRTSAAGAVFLTLLLMQILAVRPLAAEQLQGAEFEVDPGSRVGGEPDGAIVLVDSYSGNRRVVSVGGALFNPSAWVAGPDGLLFVVDEGPVTDEAPALMVFDGRLLRVDPVTGDQTVVSSGGMLVNPVAVVLEPTGELLVLSIWSDAFGSDADTLIRIDPSTGRQSLVSALQDVPEPRRLLPAGLFLPTDDRSCPACLNHHDRRHGLAGLL
jgi:hypothetical protein